jgi:hypothetical protein
MIADSKDVLIKKIIDDALGDLADWQKPIALPSIGPKFPELADQFHDDVLNMRQELHEILESQSVETLTNRYRNDNYNGAKTLRDPKGVDFLTVRKIKTLLGRKPAWFIAGWHIKELELDVPHWRAFSRCNLLELTIMSVGLDPRKVGYDALFERYYHLTKQDKMLNFLEDQFEAIANGLSLDPDDEKSSVDLEVFYRWARKVKFKLDDRFRRFLREKYGDVSSDATAAEIEQPSPLQRPSTLYRNSYDFHARLFYAIAADRFGMASIDDLGHAAKKIQSAAELQGQTPLLRPIRQFLTRGHELESGKK